MYTNNFGTQEYPYHATFYHIGVDENLPLDQQKEEKIVSYETDCDISDAETGLDNDKITLFIPFDANSGSLKVGLGEAVEVESYGVVQKGRVLGVFPSQLGGVKILCKRG